jgi:hypothetical protein
VRIHPATSPPPPPPPIAAAELLEEEEEDEEEEDEPEHVTNAAIFCMAANIFIFSAFSSSLSCPLVNFAFADVDRRESSTAFLGL